MKTYYDRRAAEYDDWWHGDGLFATVDRPGWDEEVDELAVRLRGLRPAQTLDVACGTGFLTRLLPGDVTGLDQSETMLERARRQAPAAALVRGDALALPFADDAFERVFTSHFYGHLDSVERAQFLREARRVGSELLVVDSALRPGVPAEAMQERVLSDGSRWSVLKRYFTAEQLANELGGGETLHAGRWFVAVRA